MNRLSLFCLIAGTAALSSCSNSSSNGLPNKLNIPLAQGNVWVFDTTYFTPDGVSHKGGIDSMKITGQPILSPKGDTYYDFNGDYVTERPDGLYKTDPANFFGPFLWLKYPANSGDQFRDVTKFFYYIKMPFPVMQKPDSMATLGPSFTVNSTNAEVSVPAGTFTCYSYQTDWFEINSHAIYQRDILYFAPEKGPVETEHYSIYDTTTSSLHLIVRTQLDTLKIPQ